MNETTIEAAAEAVGMSRRAIYSRMKGRGFQLIFQQARESIVQGAASALQAHIGEAIAVISQIMQDEEAAPAVRLQAAGMILSQADKFVSRVSSLHRETNGALSSASSFAEILSAANADEEYG